MLQQGNGMRRLRLTLLIPQPALTSCPSDQNCRRRRAIRLKQRLPLALALLVFGVIWAALSEHEHSGSQLASFLATLLIIGGLCWILVLLVHAAASRR